MYHGESRQEGFLVLSGECIAIVEGEERQLKAWDFVHCPPWTEHVFVGAGDGPCVMVMVGKRGKGGEILYPVNEAAVRHGASVLEETTKPDEAYARFPDAERTVYREGWLPVTVPEAKARRSSGGPGRRGCGLVRPQRARRPLVGAPWARPVG